MDRRQSGSPYSSFLNLAVDAEVEWPNRETVFRFGRQNILIYPGTAEYQTSLHIDLFAYHISHELGKSILNHLLSIASWLDDAYSIIIGGLSGSACPIRLRRETPNISSSILPHWCNSWAPIEDQRIRRALAIYREAVNMIRVGSLPYAVLGFYRVLEAAWPNGVEREKATKKKLESIVLKDKKCAEYLATSGYDGGMGPNDLWNFLYVQCRSAAAHAKSAPFIDPDDARDQRRMGAGVYLLRELARSALEHDMSVSTSRWPKMNEYCRSESR